MTRDQSGCDPLLSLHTFAVDDWWYAVEEASGSALELSPEVGNALLAMRRGRAHGQAQSAAAPAPDASPGLALALNDLRSEVARYAAGGKRMRWGDADAQPRSVELCLCVTFRCNLACKYCFSRLGPRQGQAVRPSDMTLDTAKGAVDFALDHLMGRASRLTVSFGHTGEPLLMKELYEQVGKYVCARSVKDERLVDFGMTATSLVIARDDALPAIPWPVVSLDGPQEVHDRVRVTARGGGTHKSVVANLPRLLASSPSAAEATNLTATITAYSTNIKDIFLHLASLGAPFVTLYPVRLPPDSEMAITPAAAEALLSGYSRLLEHLLSLDGHALESHVRRMVHRQDYFGRLVLRVGLNQRVRRRCDAGFGTYAVTPDGDVFPCPELAALGVMRMGSIREGVDSASAQRLRSRTVWDLRSCAACWARLLCGGDCLSNRAMYEPFGPPPDPGMCAFTRGLIERAVHLVTRLRGSHPEVLSTLLHARRPR